MRYSIAEIASALGAEAAGDLSLRVGAAAEPAAAGEGDIALALAPAYAEQLSQGRARAAVVWPGADWQGLGLRAAIFAPRGRLAMARLTGLLAPDPGIAPGIHPSAVIDPSATIGAGVAIGPLAVIGPEATIGAGCRIGAQVTVGQGAVIGVDALIHAGVRVGARVRIGARFIAQPNAVVGSDGFSFVTSTPSHVEVSRATMGKGPVTVPEDPTWHRIHSLGSVVIGDDVEIGACVTIDAGTIRPTRIGNGCKLDNQVHVGHNVVLGDHCLMAGQSGVAGSTVIGERVVIGGQSGLADNIRVGSDVVISGATVVMSNVPGGRVMMGSPAVRMEQQVEIYKALRRLPRWMSQQKAVSNLPETD